MQKALIILACVPITPIVVGTVAVYRRWSKWRNEREVVPRVIAPAVPDIQL